MWLPPRHLGHPHPAGLASSRAASPTHARYVTGHFAAHTSAGQVRTLTTVFRVIGAKRVPSHTCVITAESRLTVDIAGDSTASAAARGLDCHPDVEGNRTLNL